MDEREETQVSRTADRSCRGTCYDYTGGWICFANDSSDHRDHCGNRVLLRSELKNKLRWDDALDVWGVHGVGGFLGIVLLGVLADANYNPGVHTNGLLLGNAS